MKTLSLACALMFLSLGWMGCDPAEDVPDAPSIDAPSERDVPSDTRALDTSVIDAPIESDAPSEDTGTDAPALDDAGTLDDAGQDDDAGCLPTPCPPPPDGCGYVDGSACECGRLVCEDALCAAPCGDGFGCDRCASVPMCVVPPEPAGRICPGIYAPVCGCDGNTYSNGCVAGDAGVGVMHDGECLRACGDANCADGEICTPCETPSGAWERMCLPDGASCPIP